MRIHSYITSEEIKGPGKGLCLICEYALHEDVDKAILRGVTPKSILSSIKRKITKSGLGENIKPILKDIKFHTINCSNIKRSERLIAKKARRALKSQKKTIAEVNEMVMDHISRSLELSSSLSEDELKRLKPEDKMKLATEATKLLQTEKKIALEAQKAGIEKARFLMETGKLASGSAIIDESEEEPELLPLTEE